MKRRNQTVTDYNNYRHVLREETAIVPQPPVEQAPQWRQWAALPLDGDTEAQIFMRGKVDADSIELLMEYLSIMLARFKRKHENKSRYVGLYIVD